MYANKNGFRTAVLSGCSRSKHLRPFKSIIRPDTSSLRIESKSISCLNERRISNMENVFQKPLRYFPTFEPKHLGLNWRTSRENTHISTSNF